MEFAYVRAETITLVQVSTIHVACSLSAMLEQAQLDALDTCRVVTRRDVTSQVEFWLYAVTHYPYVQAEGPTVPAARTYGCHFYARRRYP